MNEYTGRDEILKDLEQRVEDKILEPSNYDLLKKLIENADTLDEAIKIAELGTTYKRTGFHFDKKLEKQSDAISYFKKNEELSFVTDPDATTHKLIIGDNYPALLNLLVEYKGKIDAIYIDPPYGKDSMGEFAQTNYENAISRDNLLSMLYPRVCLAKQLLSESGVIFCSIDDKNEAYVKGLFDEISGEVNYVETIMVELSNTGGMKVGAAKEGKIAKNGEFVLVYSKSPDGVQQAERTPLYDFIPGFDTHFNLWKEDDGTIRKFSEVLASSQTVLSEMSHYDVQPKNNAISLKQFAKYFDKSDVLQKFVLDNLNRIVRPRNEVPTIPKDVVNSLTQSIWTEYTAVRRNDSYYLTLDQNGVVIQLVPIAYNYRTTDDFEPRYGRSVIRGDFWKGFWIDMGNISKEGGVGFNNGKKPVRLIRQLLKWAVAKNQSAVVLDFFAGSGTTGQAVLELNGEDEGKRQFILVTNNEITDATPNGVAVDVTSQRLKGVMTGEDYKGIKNSKSLGDNLEVIEIVEVSNRESIEGKTAFDVIDETLYGQEKLGVNEKIKWVATNFEQTQKRLEEK